MKNNIIKNLKAVTFAILSLSMANAFAQNTSNTTKATATLSATCTISANSLSFGTLMLPLYAQQNSTSMNVLCSREAPYTIELAYGGIYGKGGGVNTTYIMTNYGKCSNSGGCSTYMEYDTYNAAGTKVATASRVYGTVSNSLNPEIVKEKFASLLSCSYSGSSCSTGNPSYDYGVMGGASKGGLVAYSISVPGDSSKVWNVGNNSYTSTGIGSNQTIPVIGKIIPDKSDSTYPAPDFYMDTVTATINY